MIYFAFFVKRLHNWLIALCIGRFSSRFHSHQEIAPKYTTIASQANAILILGNYKPSFKLWREERLEYVYYLLIEVNLYVDGRNDCPRKAHSWNTYRKSHTSICACRIWSCCSRGSGRYHTKVRRDIFQALELRRIDRSAEATFI